ncbi:hypothetical protein CI238_02721 [Colletotrichum incanum]|uniref:Uncharacterized protein n=1 Tax=Colletotrichum incanum TaxID=1573173 RepID=A0A167DPC3_COLIC|nr:hypothetical protein CI238_02721 [Colletotrichum incanum]
MSSLLDSQLPARRFLRRGAVTGLVDPSAGDSSLQGLQTEWPAEALVPNWERYEITLREPQPRRPLVMPIPRARAQRVRRVRIGLWLAISFAAIAEVVVVWAVVFNVFFFPRREATKAIMVETLDAGRVKARSPWWETACLLSGIVFRIIVVLWRGYHLITRGSQCLVDFLACRSFARKIFINEPLMNCITMLSCAILPTAMSAFWTTPLPGGFCNPEHNILRFWPPRTRNDIKAILNAWIGLATVRLKFEGAFVRVVKCKITIGRVLMWILGVGVWTTVEIYYAPCHYFPLVWRLWFSIMSVSFASWVLGNAEALIVKEWEAVESLHVELLAYLVTF